MDGPSLKPRRRWLRFSLRFLFFLVAMIAIPLAWKFNQVRNQRVVVAEVEKLGGAVQYDYQIRYEFEPPGPQWLRRVLGEDFFANVESVGIDALATDAKPIRYTIPDAGDATFSRIATLAELRELVIESDTVTDDGVGFLTQLRHLEGLSLSRYVPLITDRAGLNDGDAVNDRGLSHIAKLNQLKRLSFRANKVTDDGLSWLANLPELSSLDIIGTENTQITDHGMKHLVAITKLTDLGLSNVKTNDPSLQQIAKIITLETLEIVDAPITDSGLKYLEGIKSLKVVWLRNTRVTAEGVEHLRQALPDCKVSVWDREGLSPNCSTPARRLLRQTVCKPTHGRTDSGWDERWL